MNRLNKVIYQQVVPALGRLCIRKNKFINVLYYHDVVDGPGASFMRINADLFRRHMEYLTRIGVMTFRFDDLDRDDDLIFFKQGNLLITFDDGWKSNYEIFPLMRKLGIKYNVFLEVGKIGVDPGYLTWEQIRQMYQSGIVGFGAHTYTHPNMGDLANYDVGREVFEANETIKEKLGIIPSDFCFPFGAYSDESLQQIVDTKQYRRIYTSDLNYSYEMGRSTIFGRNAISNDEAFSVFVGKAKGYYNIFKSLTNVARNGK